MHSPGGLSPAGRSWCSAVRCRAGASSGAKSFETCGDHPEERQERRPRRTIREITEETCVPGGITRRRCLLTLATLLVSTTVSADVTSLLDDENLGLALVDLCLDDEPSARVFLRRALNRNAMLILDALDDSRPFDYRAIDYDDPTLNGFYWNLATASKRPAYSLLAPVAAEFDRRHPDGELGNPGLFDGAFFYASASSDYLQVLSTFLASVLGVRIGLVVDLMRNDPLSITGLPDVILSLEETSTLKCRSVYSWKHGDAPSVVACRVLAEDRIRWRKEYPGCVRVGFSPDDAAILVYAYPSVFETGGPMSLLVERLSAASGKVIRANHQRATLGEIDSSFRNAAALIPGYPEFHKILRLVSPESSAVFEGNATYGTFTLRHADGRVIRRFRFSSDVEERPHAAIRQVGYS